MAAGRIHPAMPTTETSAVECEAALGVKIIQKPAAALSVECAMAAGHTEFERKRSHPKIIPMTVQNPIIKRIPRRPFRPVSP